MGVFLWAVGQASLRVDNRAHARLHKAEVPTGPRDIRRLKLTMPRDSKRQRPWLDLRGPPMKLRASVLACVTAFLPLQNAFAVEPGWPQSIAIATASPGGTYYVYAKPSLTFLAKS